MTFYNNKNDQIKQLNNRGPLKYLGFVIFNGDQDHSVK